MTQLAPRYLGVGALVILVALQTSQRVGQAQGPRGFGGFFRGGMDGPELELVEMFDRDANGRLDRAERGRAREWLNQGNRGFRRGFRGGFGRGTPGPALTPADVETVPASVPLYEPTALRTLFLEFEGEDWEQELEDFHGTDVEVPARVTVDGVVYDDVGVHFRGASSFMMTPAGLKRSLNLSFDFADDAQRLYGYRTLNLLNAANDPTFVKTTLYGEIARHYGPTPRTNYVRVVINGESWGIYVNAQQFNSDFTDEMFGSRKGARWKVPGSPRGMSAMAYLGEDLDSYQYFYEIKTKDRPESWSDLAGLFRVLNETPPDELEAALAPIFDVDGALEFLAVEMVLVNSDGYWARASDFNIYEEPNGVFHVVPHDFNEGFGGEGGFGMRFGGPTLDPLVGLNDRSKPLRMALLAVPALRERYLGYVREIADEWLDWSRLQPIVEDYQSLIEADVETDTRKLYGTPAFRRDVASLQRFIEQRRAFLLDSGRP